MDRSGSENLADKSGGTARIRLRAGLDAALICGTAALVALLAPSEGRLAAAMGALGIGILLFVLRRSSDFDELARRARRRERELEGRGLSLSEWHAGASLEPWQTRRARHSAQKPHGPPPPHAP